MYPDGWQQWLWHPDGQQWLWGERVPELALPGDTITPHPIISAARVQQLAVSRVPQPTGSPCKQGAIHQARPGPGLLLQHLSRVCTPLTRSSGYTSVRVLWIARAMELLTAMGGSGLYHSLILECRCV